MVHYITLQSDCFTWQQAEQNLPLIKFSVSGGPCIFALHLILQNQNYEFTHSI